MKLLMLISGGIDSSVAAYMISENFDTDFIFFNTSGKGALDKVAACIRQINFKRGIKKKAKLYVVPYEMPKSSPSLACIVSKRMMYRISERIGNDCRALATGESLGHVANIFCLDEAAERVVLRPLLGFDKAEIMKIAEEIGMHEISKQRKGAAPNACRIEEVWEAEKSIDMEKIASNAAKNMLTVSV